MRQSFSKKEIGKLLVEERKKMRVQQKQSLFMRRTLTIYNSQRNRAVDHKAELSYTLEQFRAWFSSALVIGKCAYCSGKLTIRELTPDHRSPFSADVKAPGHKFTLDELAATCKSCNWQKGIMNEEQFMKLRFFLLTFPADIAADIKKRLTVGGKWAGQMFK